MLESVKLAIAMAIALSFCTPCSSGFAEEYIEIGDSLFLEERKYAPAIREYNKAIKLDPNRWGVYIDRGYAKYLLDDFKGAEADYVLGRYKSEEQTKVTDQLKLAMTAIEKVIAEGYDAAQMNFNQKKKKNKNKPVKTETTIKAAVATEDS